MAGLPGRSRPSIVLAAVVFSVVALAASLLLPVMAGAQSSPSEPIEGVLLYEWGDPRPEDGKSPIERIVLDRADAPTIELEIGRELLAGGVFRWNGSQVRVHPAKGARSLPGERLPVAAIRLLAGGEKSASEKVSGSQPWVSILCKFADVGDEPENLAYFQEMYANQPGGLDHYWREVSAGAVDIVGSIAIDWKVLPRAQGEYVTEPGEGTDANLGLLFEDCTGAADPFVDFANGGTPFAGINMMFNGRLDCCAWGGGRNAVLDGVSKVWRVTWEPPWGYADEGVIAHEMGHGFGLPHANNGDGDANPYDSPWDVMSAATSHSTVDSTYGKLGKHVNAHHKNRLGWVPEARRLDVVAPSVQLVTIDRTDLAETTNYRMAKIPYADGSSFYTVEVRKRLGHYESSLPGDGVILHQVVPGRSQPSWLVDADFADFANTPGSRWTVGETYVDLVNEVWIEVLAETPDGFTLAITSGDPNALFRDGFETGSVLAWSDVLAGDAPAEQSEGVGAPTP